MQTNTPFEFVIDRSGASQRPAATRAHSLLLARPGRLRRAR